MPESDGQRLCRLSQCQTGRHYLDRRCGPLFRSLPIAQRGHCARCGTSLSFVYDDRDAMGLTVAAFDHRDYFQPTHRSGVESMHGQWLDTSALPAYSKLDHEPNI